jgi:hypothetical protein
MATKAASLRYFRKRPNDSRAAALAMFIQRLERSKITDGK